MKENKVLGILADKALSGQQLVVYRARLAGRSLSDTSKLIDRSDETVRLITNSALLTMENYLNEQLRLEQLEARIELLETKEKILKDSMSGYDIEPNQVLNEKISDMPFSVRTRNVLKALFPEGKILDLARTFSLKGEAFFLKQKNCGRGTVKEIEEFLIKRGIRHHLWK